MTTHDQPMTEERLAEIRRLSSVAGWDHTPLHEACAHLLAEIDRLRALKCPSGSPSSSAPAVDASQDDPVPKAPTP